MNLGLDIDGTITASPKFFAFLSKAVKESGGKVFIVTSRSEGPESRRDTVAELRGHGLCFDELHMIPGFEEAAAACPHAELDWYKKYLWQKVDYSLKKKISVFFDDDEKVLDLFAQYAPRITVFRPSGTR